MTQQVNRGSNVGRGQGAWPGGAQGDTEAGPEAPQALQVPRGRQDLCVCVCVCVCVRGGRGAGLHMAFCGFGGSGELEAEPVGGAGLGWELGETGELWGKEGQLLWGQGGASAHLGSTTRCGRSTPASATPEPRPRTEAEVPSPPTPRALPCGRSGLEHLKSVRKASHGQACGWGGPCPGGGPGCDQPGGAH